MGDTKIEWPTKVWNPVTGCTPASEGCRNCYAERDTGRNLPGHHEPPFSTIRFHPDRLDQPLRWRKPQRIFVCSMGDLFHHDVQDHHLREIWFTMMAAKQHTMMVLTKRPENILPKLQSVAWKLNAKSPLDCPSMWPSHLWLGVSVEDQKTADERIPILLQTPAALRFVSVEPMLGPVNFNKMPGQGPCSSECPDFQPCGETRQWICHQQHHHDGRCIDWVICGGESGPGARPMHPDWPRSLRDQCKAAGVPFFFKQWGEWLPDCLCLSRKPHRSIKRPEPGKMGVMFRCGKNSRFGNVLDGRVWAEFPEGR